MGIILLLSKSTGHRQDSLNSLGFACIILFLIKPLYIYDLSFLLSFVSVFAIVCLYNPISKVLKKILKGKMGKSLSELIAMTLSANIGIYPLMAYYFNTFSVYSLLVNIILLPLINIAFILLFASSILALILPFLGFLLKPAGWIILLVNKSTFLIGNLPYAEIIIFSLGGLAVIYYLGVFVLGGYINIHKKLRALVSILLAIFFSVSITATNISAVYKENTFIALDSYTSHIGIVTTSQDSKYLIGEINDYNYYLIKDELIARKIRKLDSIIITQKPSDVNALILIAKTFYTDKIAVLTDDWALCDEIEIAAKIGVIQIFDNINYKVKDLSIYSHSYDHTRLGTVITVNGKSILYPLTYKQSSLEVLSTLCRRVDIVVSDDYYSTLDGMLYLVKSTQTAADNVINLSKTGTYTISL